MRNDMRFDDFREFLDELARRGLLKDVEQPVDKNWEVSSVMRWIYQGMPEKDRFAIRFKNVKGYDFPVVVGALGASYKSYAVAIGLDPELPRAEILKQAHERWQAALKTPIPPVVLDNAKGAPCKENIIKGDKIDIHKLPFPVWTPEKDPGSKEGYGFITAGFHISKDPDNGICNVGTYRNRIINKPDQFCVRPGISSGLRDHFKRNEARGKATEVALVLGTEPTVGLVSVNAIPADMDELAVAGGLKGEAIKLVRCETVDLEVPATAEIVIEGRLLPASEEPYRWDGPFGEYTGYQGPGSLNPVFQITCITHRNNAILQTFISQFPPSESSKLRQMGDEGFLLSVLNNLVGGITAIHVPEATQRAIVVSVKKVSPGHPRRVANALTTMVKANPKFIIVVDDDIDVYSWDDVLWAVTFRTPMLRERCGVQFIDGMDPVGNDYSVFASAEEEKAMQGRYKGLTMKLFIDATRPYKPYPATSLPPRKYLEMALKNWSSYGLPPLANPEVPVKLYSEERDLLAGEVRLPKQPSVDE
jgi:4-hydroxy-3-polyprenylbenzoate decarboxylase